MASWACSTCRTVYAVGIPACPHCGSTDYSDEEAIVAKASAEGGATSYVAEGDAVPADVPEGVRLVGPGAPVAEGGAAEDAEGPSPEAEAPVAVVTPGEFEDFTAKHGVTWEKQPDEVKPGSSDDEDGPPDYMAYRVTDLRDLCRDRGLPVTGAKADLAAALAAWDADHPDGGPA
jgi:hypothetical protein